MSASNLWLRATTFLAACVLGALIASCGGGASDVAGVGSGGTGITPVTRLGTISGFGSVFVNGVRYDDSNATISDDDGVRNRSELKLGMVVRLEAQVSTGGSATATSITFASELLGPVSAISASGGEFTIIGQRVLIDSATVFDPSLPQGAASIQIGQILEVHGFLNAANNTLQASLIERKANASQYKLSGIVRQLQNASKTFQIGSEIISFANVATADLPPGLIDGLSVKLRLLPQQVAAGTAWQLTKARSNEPGNTVIENLEIEGIVTDLTSPTQFKVNNQLINARNAAILPSGAVVQQGARVQVEGKLQDGVLLASEVEIKNVSDQRIELIGTISNLNTSATSFSVAGVSVNYSAAQFENGSAAALINGARIELRGKPAPGSAIISAERIKFKN